jgi:hypothetical protein
MIRWADCRRPTVHATQTSREPPETSAPANDFRHTLREGFPVPNRRKRRNT